MSKPLKIAIGLGLTLLVVLTALLFFLRHLVTKSFPLAEGTSRVVGLHDNLTIYRDRLGVPHVLATNEHDMFFGAGYVHAQDRLWQMDVIRRTAQGRLSEILGPATVEFDKLFRTVGIAPTAREIEKRLHPESGLALEAYARGVNAYVEDHLNALPVEFDILNYRPEPWEPAHTIMVARMIAWDLTMASMADLALGMIADRVDVQRSAESVPGSRERLPKILASLGELRKELEGHLVHDPQSGGVAGGARWGTWFLATNYKFRMAGKRIGGGSNCWAVGPRRSATGNPLLANDIHLVMPVPALWHQLHLTSPGWDVAGVSLPGSPLIVVGRNRSIAWGVTNAMVDDADFFIEELDSSLGTYAFRGKSLPVVVRPETIYIGARDSLIFARRATHHGPLLDELHPSSPESSVSKRYFIAMQWTGHLISDEVYAFYAMNRAGTPKEFEEGVRNLAVPGQNVVYADTLGNIGLWFAARIPIRGTLNPMLPMPGWTGEYEWRGLVPFLQLPKVWNPPEGFIASANNPVGGGSYYISELWEPPSRITRIRELLSPPDRLTPEDFKRFQADIVSPHGRDFAMKILASFAGDSTMDGSVAAALEYLRNWDFRYSKDDVAPAIVNATFVRFVHNVFKDEMGDSLLAYYAAFSGIPFRVTDELLSADSSAWFDDIGTASVESRDEILRKSLYDALVELRAKLGSDTKLWRWGNIHTVSFAHPFGRVSPLDKVFNIGPFAIGGSGSTVFKTEFRLMDPYEVAVGPSMRHVIDLSDRMSMLSVVTSGESGQPLHPHYDDQSVLWLNGEYHTLHVDGSRLASQGWERLILQPRQ